MPAFDEDPDAKTLPFPPLSKTHIINCSYHSWHPKYRSITPKARLIPLSQSFLNYLRADGIVLPPDPKPAVQQSGVSKWDDGDDDPEDDPSTAWTDIHDKVVKTVAKLDGCVAPKLNWSAPKDATWINPTNSQECHSANDVYLMLKSSDFVTHDLEHAFDDCADDEATPEIPYHLVLRKHFNMNPSVEFRCFVRRRTLLGICQRDLNHFDFLFDLRPKLLDLIRTFFDKEIKQSFPDDNFTFDVYVPNPYTRVWLIDVNPWAVRTDPLLYSWLELLTMPDPDPIEVVADTDDIDLPDGEDFVVRIPIRPRRQDNTDGDAPDHSLESTAASLHGDDDDDDDEDDDEVESPSLDPTAPQPLELRLIRKTDPEAYTFNTPQYSAHKLPRDVVDASQSGPGPMQDFALQWRDALERRNRGEDEGSDEDE